LEAVFDYSSGEPRVVSFTFSAGGSRTWRTSCVAGHAGQIVGACRISAVPHGFLLDVDGSYTTFNVPFNATETIPFGINDAGQIVGRYYIGLDAFLGFLATPLSQPSSARTSLSWSERPFLAKTCSSTRMNALLAEAGGVACATAVRFSDF
jgi:hypothetical protein